MVEMLGVLAIVGVLSIGGIAGYTLSMRKHRVNTIMDIITKYAVIVNASCVNKLRPSSGDQLACPSSEIIPFEETGLPTSPDIKKVWISWSTLEQTTIEVIFNDQAICKAARSFTVSFGSDTVCPDNWLMFKFQFDPEQKNK